MMMSRADGAIATRHYTPADPGDALQPTATAAIQTVASFLGECGFRHASTPGVLGSENVLFPDFDRLHRALSAASRFHRFLFSIFRQGHAAEERHARAYLPEDVLTACVQSGLLVQDHWGEYRTPDVGIVSLHGLDLIATLPATYMTSSGRGQAAHIGLDTLLRIAALPASLRGRRVLDLRAEGGALGLVCAARGAARVVCVPTSRAGATITRFNAAFNGFSDVVEVRAGLDGLPAAPAFDYFVADFPLIPRPTEPDALFAQKSGHDGTAELPALLEQVLPLLQSGFEGLVFCEALGDSHQIFVNQQLKQHAREQGYHVRAFVGSKTPVLQYRERFLTGAMAHACGRLSLSRQKEKALMDSWLHAVKASKAENVYSQTLSFQRPAPRSGLTHVPFYEATGTDPLVSLVNRHRSLA